MRGFAHALRSEMFLAARSRGTMLLLLLAPACAALRITLGVVSGAGARARNALFGAAQAAADNNAYGPFVDGLLAGFAAGALILAALAAGMLAARREQG